MTVHSANREEIRQYLLGGLSEEIRQRIEESLLTDNDFLEEIEVCEEELIDDYVNNELDYENRTRFAQYFLCAPDRMQKLKFAMALGRLTSQAQEDSESELSDKQVPVTPAEPGWGERLSAFWNAHVLAFRNAATVAAVVLIAVVALNWPTPTYVAMTISISTSQRAEGASAERVILPLKADTLRITLKLPDPSVTARDFRVELLDANEQPKPLDVETRDSQTLTVVIPADQLARGDYALKLFMIKTDGTEERVTGSYFFKVE